MAVLILAAVILAGGGYIVWSYENIVRMLQREVKAERDARRALAASFAAFRTKVAGLEEDSADPEKTEICTVPGRCIL